MRRTLQIFILALVAMLLNGCKTTANSTADIAADITGDVAIDANQDTTEDGDTSGSPCADHGEGLRAEHFVPAALEGDITEVDCTLSDGTETTCYRVVVVGTPADHEIGPFCPRHIDDAADVTGIWLESGAVHDVDGAFIKGLAEFYNDPEWLLYDPDTGVVNVTLTQEACEAAARPDVAEEYQNYCVECSIDDIGATSHEFLIPKTPTPRATPSELGMSGVGVMLNGVKIDPPAPVAAILGAHTIAAFDDCGGHVNPADGYHYHAATGCSKEVGQCDAHAPLIGYALDGYALHAMVGDDGVEPTDLDECRGHSDATRGYHYHAASAGENMFIGCFHGQTVGEEGGGPGGVVMCADVPPGMLCCGDGTCGGPETAANCSEDCP